MAISPFKFGNSKSNHTPPSLLEAGDEPLTLSQAFIITAGLAGLIGLCGGVIIRFSLATSHNARFLSPLQTFPTLSNWTSEASQEATDIPRLHGDVEPDAESYERRSLAGTTFTDSNLDEAAQFPT